MKEGEILPKMLRLIEATYSSTQIRVRAAGQKTISFEMLSDVRQGDDMPPILFNYAIDFDLERALRRSQGVQADKNLYTTDLTHADDITLRGDSAQSSPSPSSLDNIDRFAPKWWDCR